jgi:fructokinase
MNKDAVHVGIELGGTKIVIGASDHGADLLYRNVIATVDPDTTLSSVSASLEGVFERHHVRTIGIASFGPIDLRRESATFGTMLSTPKPGWSGVDVVSGVDTQGVAVAIDTDVNAALIAERMWGAGTGENVAYLTVGTGIGGAIWSDGSVLHGANHSEIGHVRVPRHPDDDFPGICPFHGDCLEGMASGTAMRERWGVSASALGGSATTALAFEAWYLAHAIASLCAVIPVDQVIIGGGVAKMPGFHTSISGMLSEASGGYPPVPFAEGGPQILPPGLGDDAGVIGAIELGRLIHVV